MRANAIERTGAVEQRRHGGLIKVLIVVAALFASMAASLAEAGQAWPVFRFYNTRTGTHFYTINGAERDSVLNNYPWFAYEGAVFYAYTAPDVGVLPVYRFYNTRTFTHFYTISESEKDFVIANYPVFIFEGPVYYAPPTMMAGATSLYRFYNTKTGAHFYTTSVDERDHVLATWPWFAYEGAVYDVFTTPTPGGGGQNSAPKATLAVSSTTVTAPTMVTLTATATDTDGTIANVQFFMNGTLLGQVDTAPYVFPYNVAAAGSLSFTAVATDNLGASGSSSPIVVTATGGGGNQPPKVTIAASSTSISAPGTSTITATATDADGTVQSVVFYQGGTLVSTVTSAPYTYTFNATTAGAYSFYAVAMDDQGATASSNFITVTAGGGGTNQPPHVSLAASSTAVTVPGSTTLTATATDSDGTVASVKFYNGTTLLTTVTTAPYTYSYAIASAGSYSLTAVATDNQGATATSNVVAVTAVTGGSGSTVPKIGLSISANQVLAPQAITLTGTGVSSPNGAISRVSFYMNGAKLTDVTTAPYTYQVNIPAAGTYTFYAEAADVTNAVTQTLTQNVVGSAGVALNAVTPDVYRLLNQATFGFSQTEAQRVQQLGVTGWVDDQFTQPVSGYPDTKYNRIQLGNTPDCTNQDPNGVAYPATFPQPICQRDHLTLAMLQRDFYVNALTAPDQLRQRVAWALSQIIVTSGNQQNLSFAYVMSRYQNLMFNNAFGNYKTLLDQVSVSPAMGDYLTAVNNDRASGARVPNENYAREIMQLFSIGLEELNPDGSVILDVNGNSIPTYDQNTIKEFAKVFTGLTFADPANPLANATKKNPPYYASPMVPYPITANSGHETSIKNLLNGTVVPANQTVQQDFDAAVTNVFAHPNTPVYIGKQLIQKLVTGNPSPGYIQRISQVFVNNGQGVRGDLKAVVRAILLDPEARGSPADPTTFGSLREPVLAVTSLLRATGSVSDGNRLEGAASGLGQRPYYSPTVFNYFPQDGTLPNSMIDGPEFTIHTTNSAISRANLMYTLIYNGYAADGTISNATGTKTFNAQFEALSANPASLVDAISKALLAGQLPAGAQAQIVTAVNAVPVASTTARVQMALYLVASSYFYQVQN
jgi:uncharacterized protein (DUF1800 family)